MYRNNTSGGAGKGRGRGRGNTNRFNEMPPHYRQNYNHTKTHNEPNSVPSQQQSLTRGRGRGIDKTRPAWLSNKDNMDVEQSRSKDNPIDNHKGKNNDHNETKSISKRHEENEKHVEQKEKHLNDHNLEEDDNDDELLKQLAAASENNEDEEGDIMLFAKSKEDQEEEEARKLRLRRLKRKQNILDKHEYNDSLMKSSVNKVAEQPAQKQKLIPENLPSYEDKKLLLE